MQLIVPENVYRITNYPKPLNMHITIMYKEMLIQIE